MAVREPDRLFVNGVDLGKQWFLTVESTYQMPAQVRDGMVETPGRHGAHVSGRPPVYDMGAGKLVLRVGKPERGHLREVLDELIGLLTGGSEVVLEHSSGGTVRESVIQVQSWSVGDRAPQIYADLEVSYVVPGVFLRAEYPEERSLPAGTSILPREGTAPVTDALVRFAGPSSGAHTVSEGVWGTGVTWTGSLVSGQHVFIDPLAMRAWQGAAGDWGRPWATKDVSGGLVPATAGPLALHHTTGWGQGEVTATNYALDPFYERTPVGSPTPDPLSVSQGTIVERNGKRWMAHVSTYEPRAGSGYIEYGPRVLELGWWAGRTLYVGGTVDVTQEAWGAGVRPSVTIIYQPWPGAGLKTVEHKAPGPGVHTLQVSHRFDAQPSQLYVRHYHAGIAGTPPAYWRGMVVSGQPVPFDGDTPDTDELVYEWTGTPGASTSTVGPRVLTRSTPLTASKAATLRYKEAWLRRPCAGPP